MAATVAAGPSMPVFIGVGADVAQRRHDLIADDRRRDAVDGAHGGGVLHGDRRDGGGGIAAERGDGFDVGLKARAARRVRSGDDEDAGDLL